MTLLELYKKLCTREIKIEEGLCDVIYDHVGINSSYEFSSVMCATTTFILPRFSDGNGISSLYISKPGVMTPERETFLLLFAAYKGEL